MSPFRRDRARGNARDHLPDELHAQLVAEGLLMLEERLRGSITYRRYREAGSNEWVRYRRNPIRGAIAVSSRRFLVWVGGGKHIDVPLAHPLRPAVEVRAAGEDGVCFAYTAETFRTDRTGEVEVVLRTPRASRVIEVLTLPSPG
ncbi:hypothetical protein [Streptomyces sp. 6N223]|uniref:hypothetical protein n=1 Tax=Streptomyces sp. 6N223 TaxID=3457412 RepID=UPI003FD5A563